MTTAMPDDSTNLASAGQAMFDLAGELYPICRSITGDGVRQTLGRISTDIPLEIKEILSGRHVFDWTVPNEWNVSEAWIKDPDGHTVVDFAEHNLHLVSYSKPIRTRLSLSDLKARLHSLPTQPDLIPYRTSYYDDNWGFCLEHNRLLSLTDGEYEVCINSTLEPGYLTWGEYLIKGETAEEILLSTHVCHPSLANDNCSGMALLTELGKRLAARRGRYSYRLLFIPGTIGAISWLAENEKSLSRVAGGMVISGVGDSGDVAYKSSLQGDGLFDKACAHLFRFRAEQSRLLEYSPYGYDERQFNSPGIGLAVGRLSRTPYNEYSEYHTSADNLSFIKPESLADSLSVCLKALAVIESNRVYRNLQPKGEPQLGRRGLYDPPGGLSSSAKRMAMLWVLGLSDGTRSLLDIAERSKLEFDTIHRAADALKEAGLLATLS